MLCCQITLPEHHRALALEWLTSWPQQDTPTSRLEGEEGEGEEGGEEREEGGTEAAAMKLEQEGGMEMELRHRVLKPTIFDSLGMKRLTLLFIFFPLSHPTQRYSIANARLFASMKTQSHRVCPSLFKTTNS